MALLEFHIARLTARSASDPKNPFGGKPEITVEDVQTSMTSASWPEYTAVMAKFAQSEHAIQNLLELAKAVSSREWRRNERNYRTKITNERLDLVAEAAVLKFLNPNDQDIKRDDEWCAKWISTSHNAWARDYRHHFDTVLAKLVDIYNSGTRIVRMQLNNKSLHKSTNSPETLDAA